jgi:hypothetical protein
MPLSGPEPIIIRHTEPQTRDNIRGVQEVKIVVFSSRKVYLLYLVHFDTKVTIRIVTAVKSVY